MNLGGFLCSVDLIEKLTKEKKKEEGKKDKGEMM